MERAWAWFRSCFGARVTDRVRSSDRVEHGRVEKSNRLSRSPKRRQSPNTPSPRSKKKRSRPTCEGFAETLLRVVRRDANLKLLNRLAQDINGSIEHLDELIEQEQERIEAEGDVHKRHALRDWLRKCHADREGLRRDRMRNDRNLQSDTAEQQNDEAIVFDQAAWAMEHCAGQAAVAVLDDEMLLEVDEILNTQDEVAVRESTLAAAQEEQADLRAALDRIPARLSHEAAAALDRLSDHLQELETRKAQDSRALLDRKQSLWSRCRQSLLSSGVIELDDGRPLPDPEPVQQDPPPEDVPTYEEYEAARDRLNRMQATHDGRPMHYYEWSRGFMEKFPDSTRSRVDRAFHKQCRRWTRLLTEREQEFVEIRDRILPTGAQPLDLPEYDRARLDFQEYRGDCPSDGKTGSEASDVRRSAKAFSETVLKGEVMQWLDHSEHDPEKFALQAPLVEEPSYDRLKASYERLETDTTIPARPSADKQEYLHIIDLITDSERVRAGITPWDSISRAERTTYVRSMIDGRRSTERP